MWMISKLNKSNSAKCLCVQEDAACIWKHFPTRALMPGITYIGREIAAVLPPTCDSSSCDWQCILESFLRLGRGWKFVQISKSCHFLWHSHILLSSTIKAKARNGKRSWLSAWNTMVQKSGSQCMCEGFWDGTFSEGMWLKSCQHYGFSRRGWKVDQVFWFALAGLKTVLIAKVMPIYCLQDICQVSRIKASKKMGNSDSPRLVDYLLPIPHPCCLVAPESHLPGHHCASRPPSPPLPFETAPQANPENHCATHQ